MSFLLDNIDEYCSSEFFRLQGDEEKEHVESILHYFFEKIGSDTGFNKMEETFRTSAQLDLPLPVRKSIPSLLYQYLEWVEIMGMYPEVSALRQNVQLCEDKFLSSFRNDGSVKGETFKKEVTEVGRNDPCPCGSGKKYKKCCK